jgi:hypothetical protein
MNKEIGINTIIQIKSLIDTLVSRISKFKIPDEFISFDLNKLGMDLDNVELLFSVRVLNKNFNLVISFSSLSYNYKKVKVKIIYNLEVFDLKIIDDKWLRIFKREKSGISINDITLNDFLISNIVEDNIINFLVIFLLGKEHDIMSGYDKILLTYMRKQLSTMIEPTTISNGFSSYLNKDNIKTFKSL